MEETITVKREDLKKLWEEIDYLRAELCYLEEDTCELLDIKRYQNRKIEKLSFKAHNHRKAIYDIYKKLSEILGMERM